MDGPEAPTGTRIDPIEPRRSLTAHPVEEVLGLLTDNALFHAKLLEAGGDSTLHVGEGLDHVYPMFPTPEGHRARRDLVRIVTGELT